MWFQKIKRYFDIGMWNQKIVANAVEKGKLTADEYRQIIGAGLSIVN